MKRSQVVELIAAWAKPEIFVDVYSSNYTEWADNLLHTLETEVGLSPSEDSETFEPEEGWEAYFAEQDKKAKARDFSLPEGLTLRQIDIATRFLAGESFEELADDYNVTRERIRQIVAKVRRMSNKIKGV